MGGTSWRARADVPPNKGAKYPPEVLTPGEVAAIIGQCSPKAPTGIRNRALLMLLYRSGLRVSELTALRPSDVNLTAGTVRVLHGKGNKATTRGFHPSATDALARWIDTRQQLGVRRGPLFCTLAGGPRHTFAWELERAGTPVTTISALLGHSGIAVTARYLAHLTNRQAVTALAVVDLPDVGLYDEMPAPVRAAWHRDAGAPSQ